MTLGSKCTAVASLAALFLIIGCAKSPIQQAASAKSAIELAKSAGAEQFAKRDFIAAQEALDKAMNIIKAQDRKLPFLRNYEAAAALIRGAEALAEKASEAATEEQERLRAEREKVRLESAKKKKTEKATGKKSVKK